MPDKTISIDSEAYALLARSRGEGQSFSQVIKSRFAQGKTGRDLLDVLSRVRLSESALDAIDEQVAMRQASSAVAPHL